MAKFPILVEGFDPTSVVTAITRAELLQMIHEAEFDDMVGAVLQSKDAPNVSLYPKLGFFVWHQLDADSNATGKLYVHDGTDWIPVVPSDGSISGEQIADGSVGFEKLDIGAAAAGYILRISTGLQVEAVSLSTILTAGSLALTLLAPAAGNDYIIRSAGGGTWSAVTFASYLSTFLATNKAIPHTGIYDGDNSGSQYQVLGRGAGANAGVTWSYIEALLRANSTPTAKLQFPTSTYGKLVRVNALGTDVEDGGDSLVKVAIAKYTVAKGTAAQSITAATETTVAFNSLINNDVAIVSLASNIFTLETGEYEIECSVPISLVATGTSSSVVLMLRDITASNAIIATQTGRLIAGGNTGDNNAVVTLRHRLSITGVTNDYDIRLWSTVAATTGYPANQGTYVESYQSITIRKLS